MKRSITRSKSKKVLLIAIAAVFWTLVWYIAALGIGNEIFLPYPHTVLLAFFDLAVKSAFWKSILNTMLTVVEGSLIGCTVGALFAILSSIADVARTIITPLVAVLRATPVASFIILVYVIVRRIKLPINTVSLLIVIIMVIPIVYGNLLSGIASFDRNLSEVAKIYRFSFWKKLAVLWIPQATPYILSGVTNALGFAWKAGVAAEVICNLQNTVGKNLADAKTNLEMDRLFAWTFTVILLSMLFEFVFKKAFLGKTAKRREQTYAEA